MDHNTLFAKTPPGKLFVLAALPGAIGMLASALYQLIDGILVGQVLGDTAFAAINLAMPFVIIKWAPPCPSRCGWVRRRRRPPTIFLPAPV